MMDPNDHLSGEITTEEYPAVVAQYQQWLADRDLRIAAMVVKVAKAHARLEMSQEDQKKAEQRASELQSEVTALQTQLDAALQNTEVVSGPPLPDDRFLD